MDFNSSGTIRSPFSPRVRQSLTGRRPLGLSSAKKGPSKFIQSSAGQTGEVVYKTPSMTVETFGLPLPVMVTELLTFSSGEVSVRLSACGWCWAVSGRRVVAWARDLPPSPGASPAPPTTSARELTLPQTDLAHKADLVMLFYEEGAQMPSCIGVSPEGTIRYWPSIGQEGVYVDVSAELAGQECDRLGDLTLMGLVLATTTCTVVLLKPAVVDGRATVVCNTLRPPSGWLGGIGRRVSLLFFGSMPQQVDTKLVGCVVLSDSEGLDSSSSEGSCEGYIALVCGGGPLLQLWRGPALHEHSLRQPLLQRAHLAQGDVSSLELLALDVRARGPTGLLLLLAAVNVARSPDVRYALAHISVEDPASPQVTSVVSLRGVCSTQQPPRLLPSRSNTVLLCCSSHVAMLPSNVASDKVEYIDLGGEGDQLLTAELCHGSVLLFTTKHGVLLLSIRDNQPAESVCDSPLGSPCPSDMYEGNLSLYEIDPHEVSMVTTDACGKLKTAFLFHLRRDLPACTLILDQLFPPPPPAASPASPPSSPGSPPSSPGSPGECDVDAPLDRTVISIATDMLDDIPAGDPRWKQRIGGPQTNIALGSSAALQISAHLADKQRAFCLFIDFLHATGLWNRLGRISKESGSGGGSELTVSRLGRLSALLTLAVTLRKLHQDSEYAAIIAAAISQVTSGGEVPLEADVEAALSAGALSPADALYRRVSSMPALLAALCQDASALTCHLHCNLIVRLLREVVKSRPAWLQDSLLPAAALAELNHAHRRALTQYLPTCSDLNTRSQLAESSAALADLLLSLYSHTHTPSHVTRDLLMPYFELGQIERATALAEKYKDLELLVDMCVASEDYERLQTYIDKYRGEGIAGKAYAALFDAGGRGRAALVRHFAGAGAGAGQWAGAGAGGGARRGVGALLRVARGEWAGAATLLPNCGRDTVSAQQTAASLAKLCLVASDASAPDTTDLWRKVEDRLALLEQHLSLPRDIRVHNGMDTEDTRVYEPEELVQMYIDSKSKSLTQYDYKKALDLTCFIEDMERRDELRLRVWCACALASNWEQAAGSMAEPRAQLQDKLFYKLVDLVHVMGGDLDVLLPPAEDILTAPELAELAAHSHFHYLLKYGYECIHSH